MARRSGRLSNISDAGRPSAATNGHTRKRAATDSEATPRATKIAKRKGETRITPRTSQHFTKREYDEATGLTSDDTSDAADDGDEESDFGAPDDDHSIDDDDDGDEEASDNDDVTSSEDDSPRRTKNKSTGKHTKSSGRAPGSSKMNGAELWHEGATTGLEPGTEIIIKKPKARPAGKTPYKDDTIHPNTLLFLGDLKRNNNRSWLKMHDPDFRASEKDFRAFIEVVTEKLIEVDDTIPELPVKDIVYRIYRDIRFSKDPTPYKSYFSAAWSRTGRKGPYGVYYLQVAPGQSFFGGGCWHPEAQAVSRLRDAIDRHPERLKNILMQDDIRREFLNGAPKKPEKVVKAFVSGRTNVENALKTRPQGYDKDHKDIALLRLKNFTVGRQLADDEVIGTGFVERVRHLMSVMKPYVSYLNEVVMPDVAPGDDASSDDDEEDAGEDEEEGDGEDEEEESIGEDS